MFEVTRSERNFKIGKFFHELLTSDMMWNSQNSRVCKQVKEFFVGPCNSFSHPKHFLWTSFYNMGGSKRGGELFHFFSKTKGDSDSLLFVEENPLVSKSLSKKNLLKLLYFLRSPFFLGSSTPSEEFHYFFDHIKTEMIENLFHEGHEQKTFFA